MDILIASNNAHKIAEILPFLPGHRLTGPADAGFPDFDVVEDGLAFRDNALKKAFALHGLSGGRPSLADDSGICVDALDGRPGVFSARYGAQGSVLLDSPARNALLLSEMRGKADRRCRFVCCLALVLSPDRWYCVQETCEGILVEEGRGGGGFGYDPIVYLPELGKTVAELSPEEKNVVSHRGKALRRMAALLALA